MNVVRSNRFTLRILFRQPTAFNLRKKTIVFLSENVLNVRLVSPLFLCVGRRIRNRVSERNIKPWAFFPDNFPFFRLFAQTFPPEISGVTTYFPCEICAGKSPKTFFPPIPVHDSFEFIRVKIRIRVSKPKRVWHTVRNKFRVDFLLFFFGAQDSFGNYFVFESFRALGEGDAHSK